MSEYFTFFFYNIIRVIKFYSIIERFLRGLSNCTLRCIASLVVARVSPQNLDVKNREFSNEILKKKKNFSVENGTPGSCFNPALLI